MKRKVTLKTTILQVVNNIDGKYICNAGQKCMYKQDNFSASNFKRHIQKLHPDVFIRLELEATDSFEASPSKKKPKALLVQTDKETIILGTLQLVTQNSLPLTFPDTVGFRTLVEPLWRAVGLKINRKSLTELVSSGAKAMELCIKSEMAGRMINLKIDSASRGNRHIFGINAQFFKDGEVIIRSLALREIHERQTKENLKLTIEEVMEQFGIAHQQLYSVVHDNGANMIATVKLLRKMMETETTDESSMHNVLFDQSEVRTFFEDQNQDECDDIDICEDSEEDQAKCCDENDCDDIDDFCEGKDGEENTPEAKQNNEDKFGDLMREILDSTRCAAHTAQLAVWDVFRHSGIAELKNIILPDKFDSIVAIQGLISDSGSSDQNKIVFVVGDRVSNNYGLTCCVKQRTSKDRKPADTSGSRDRVG
ncbi:uncharacterized protein LOC131687342 [Topomyia yanbarensis]|uniref:uncharacterized protein LOC131687342 n=1 Tax=Topomyia yanbarensis TaxID=2498891 RepID=UPI00273AA787|nr:uncharacterized protein LOC131687342 [Topomyia yanbarensis]